MFSLQNATTRVCAACSNVIGTADIAFFVFPKHVEKRNKWLKTIRREDLIPKLMNETVRKNLKICEIHFEKQFVLLTKPNNRKYLSNSAFPKLNITDRNGGPSTAQVVGISDDDVSLTHVSRSVQTEFKRPDEIELNIGKTTSQTEDSRKVLDNGLEQLVKWREQSEENQCSEGLMLFTLSLYKTNPQMYEFMKNILSLPTPTVLRKFFLPLATEVDQRLINVLTLRINEMTPRGKICCISVDYITLKQSLFYDITNDRIVGFNEINGVQTLKFAKYAVVIMARGIIDSWQQPIAHCFLANFENYLEVTEWVELILTILIEIGFDVRAFVTDHRSNFVTPKTRNPDGSVIAVADHEIYRLFDAPRLIGSMRAHLQTSQFIFNNEKELTTEYLENKISTLDKILNYKKRPRSDVDDSLEDELRQLQLGFLRQMLDLFKKLRLVDIETRIEKTTTAKFIAGFQVTIKSVLKLYESFECEGLNFRLTARLNLDGIRNTFKQIKENCSEPTCRQVSTMFKKTFMRNIMKGGSQEQEDLKSLLQKIEAYPNTNQPLAQARPVTSLAVETTDYNFDLPEKQVISFISKYLYRKCIDRHSQCLNMQQFLSQSQTIISSRLRHNIPHYNNVAQWAQTIPSDFFTDYIFLVETKFQDYFKGDVKNVANDVFKSIGYVIPNIPCRCFPFDYATKLYIRFRIRHTIKMNKILITQKENENEETSFNVFNLATL